MIDSALGTLKQRWLRLDAGHPQAGSHHLLRRSLMIDRPVPEAVLAITASSVCRLYVNGELITMGPARGTEYYFYADHVELGARLRAGLNTLAIEVAFFPNLIPDVLQHEFPAKQPGLGLGIQLKKDQGAIGLDEHWRCHRLTALDPEAAWVRGQRGELVHASRYPRRWMDREFDDAAWSPLAQAALSRAPADVRLRPTPQPLVSERQCVKVVDAGLLRIDPRFINEPIPADLLDWFGGRKAGLSQAISEPRRLAPRDLDRVQYRNVCEAITGGSAAVDPAGAIDSRQGACVLRGQAAGGGYAVYDLGEVICGTGWVEATVPDGARLDMSLLEWLDTESGGPDECRQRAGRIMCGYGGLSILGDGRCIRFHSIHHNNFRYLCLAARDLQPGQAIHVHCVGATEVCAIHRADVVADAICSDPVLNRIVEATKQTIRVTAHDWCASGGTHERVLTAGDCLQASEAGRVFYGELGRVMSRRTFDLFIDQGTKGVVGWTRTPSGRAGGDTRGEHEQVWPLAPCLLVLDMIALAREGHRPLPDRDRQLALGMARDVEQHLTREGLIGSDPKARNWCDWSKMVVDSLMADQHGINVSQNAYFYRMFTELADTVPDEPLFGELAEKMGQAMRSLVGPRINACEHRIARFVPDAYIRNNAGALVPYQVPQVNVFGGCTEVVSETTQYWLLWSGVLTTEQARRLWEVLRDWRSFEIPLRDNTRMHNPARASSVMGLCPRFKYAREQRDPVVYRDARDAFGPNVLRETTLWESLELDSRAVVHPATPYVGKALYESLTGILPGDREHTVRIEPVVDQTLEWARGYRHTPAGTIGVSWRHAPQRFTLSVGLPEGYRAHVRMPEPIIARLLARGHDLADRCCIEVAGTVRITADDARGLLIEHVDDPAAESV